MIQELAGQSLVQRETSPPVPVRGSADRELFLSTLVKNPRLPSPPALALQIVELVSDPNATVQQIAELLTTDPVLCGKLLKTANSVLFSPSQPITSINQTIGVLGFNRLRSLVLSLSLPVMQAKLSIDPGLRRMWKNSVVGAVIARELAMHCKLPQPEDELITGLLRDLGMFLLQQSSPQVYGPVWNGAIHRTGEAQTVFEIETFGISHAEASAALLKHWRLPREIWEPILYHHHPDPATLEPLLAQRAAVLCFASRLANLEEEQTNLEYFENVIALARERFNLDQSQLEAMLATATPMIRALASVMQFDIGECPEFDLILTAGCEELLRLSMDTNHGGARPPELSATFDLENIADSDSGKVNVKSAGNGCLDFLEHLDRSGNQVNGYEILHLLGRGSMGVVYKARDTQLNRFVAIKAMTPEMAGSARARKRFARKAQSAALVRHENVVTIFNVSSLQEIPFIVMEYVPGLSLQDWLDHGKKFALTEIISIGKQIASGLAAAHAISLVHRDVKPANMLWEDGTGRIGITDFGLACTLHDDPHLTAQGALVGTPLYMSPEQAIGQPVGPMSDMFSLGSLLYALCTGHPPFEGESVYAILHGVMERTAPAIRLANPDIPDWLIRLIGILHSKDPVERMSAADVARQFVQHRND